MRAEFTQKTKDILAARVAYRCSYPGCSRLTIGPGHENEEAVARTGEAAHIYAASENGPRPNPSLTLEQRSAITNGIWLCKNHARLIDVDTSNFSAETLFLWKQQAEKDTYRKLETLEREIVVDSETLIALQHSLVCSAKWLSAQPDKWVFEIGQFIEGDLQMLRNFAMEFPAIATWNKFILIESQGDGRELASFSWEQVEHGRIRIYCTVKPKAPRTSPHDQGGDIAIDDNFDIFFKDGDFATVQGMDSAIQDIKVHLSTQPGTYLNAPLIGSEIPRYVEKYKSNIPLLQRLIKIEIIRLLTVSLPDSSTKQSNPSFHYINRVLYVQVLEIDERQKSATINLSIEWGNQELWEGKIKLGVNTNRQIIDWNDDDL